MGCRLVKKTLQDEDHNPHGVILLMHISYHLYNLIVPHDHLYDTAFIDINTLCHMLFGSAGEPHSSTT